MEKSIKKFPGYIILGIILFCWSSAASSAIRLPSLISDNMVIQSGRLVPVWGWADKGEKVIVTIGKDRYSAITGTDGRWMVVLNKYKSGRSLEMIVKGSTGNLIIVKNILVGEVWICSGQSNMHWTLSSMHGVLNNDAELTAANYNDIRMFTVWKKGAPEPADDVKGRWITISPENLLLDGQNGASAVAYFFGRELFKALNTPVGLINASLGGTTAERWINRKDLEADPELKSLTGEGSDASTLFNNMIAPLIVFPIRGAIWYQGEANVSRAFQYRKIFPAMISSWRSAWQQGDFPFGFVQLAPFRYQGERSSCLAEMWEAQLMTLKNVPNTGMVVTMDIGDVTNIHPKNKQEVGRRLALWALAKVYGYRRMVYSGLIYKSKSIKGNTVRLKFYHCGNGLTSSDGNPLNEFLIAGPEQEFLPAKAEIKGRTIVVSNEKIANPLAVRYAWRDDAQPNLANKEGLPASPFRTDSWIGVTDDQK